MKIKYSKEVANFIKGNFNLESTLKMPGTNGLIHIYSCPQFFIQYNCDADIGDDLDTFDVKYIHEMPKEHIIQILRNLLAESFPTT